MTDAPPTTVVDATLLGATVPGVGPERRVDVRIEHGRVAAIAAHLDRSDTDVTDARGGLLIPGLHDHHLHLLAMAATRWSLDVSAAADGAAFDAAIRAASSTAAPTDSPFESPGWLRIVGYDERLGPLDRDRLDRLAPHRPVRVQHRSGAAWMLNGEAQRLTGAAEASGWVFRYDDALGARWRDNRGDDLAHALRDVSTSLASMGVTGVTDATPFADASAFDVLAAARRSGDIAQHVTVTGGPALATTSAPAGLDRGPVKLVVRDDALPSPDELAMHIDAAHRASRCVAVHCVTRVAAVVALAAWRAAGHLPGDRIEHGSVLPPELMDDLAELGLTVVTQPAFVAARGDRYLADVDPDDIAHLYRCGSLTAAGVGVGGSTDAPYGPADPWQAMRAATTRTTPSGAVLGHAERVTPSAALDLFLTSLSDPGGRPRRVAVGAVADLCLLDAPEAAVFADLDSARVAATWIAGRRVHGDG